jgi:arylsulfatase
MLGSRAIWHKGWKAVAVHPAAPSDWSHFAEDRWELYDTDADRTEMHDLAGRHPEKVRELVDLWYHEAGKYHGLPLDDRTALEILLEERPQLAAPRARYTYPSGITEVPEASAVNVRNRSFTIAAEVEIADENAGGVLFAHGSRFGGHALYLKDGTLRYVYNFCGITEQLVVGSTRIPTGKVVLSAGFEKHGDGTPTSGTLSLYIDKEKVAEQTIRTQPGKFALAGEGLNIGRDGADPVTQDYPGRRPWPLTGATIREVLVDVSGEPYVDLEKEAVGAFMRD